MPKQIKYNWLAKIVKIAHLRDEIEEIIERTEDDEFTEDENKYIEAMDDAEKEEFSKIENKVEKFSYLKSRIKVEADNGKAAQHQDELVDLTTDQIEEYNALSEEEKEAYLAKYNAKLPEKKPADSDVKPYISFASKEEYTEEIKEKTKKLQIKNAKLVEENKNLVKANKDLQEKLDATKANRVKKVFGKKGENVVFKKSNGQAI